ncbi:TPA: hypothetical protein GRI81_24365 [Vibrio parahaemolyticus]|nr:hypothetical protein [Vibrio parahaemolyticus]
MNRSRKLLHSKYNTLYKLYCPSDNLRFICFYCGLPAGTVDHVPPLNAIENLRMTEENLNYIKVPSCSNCNSLASDEPHTNIYERQAYVKDKIKAKFGKYLKQPDWEDDEIAELDYRLKQSVISALEMKYLVIYRLEYGIERNYINNDSYLNYDPRKMLKYAKADKWDETIEKVGNKELSISEVQRILKRQNKNESNPYSYAKARSVVLKLRLSGTIAYNEWRANNKNHPERKHLPPFPPRAFQEVWSGWADFIGPTYVNKNNIIKAKSDDHLPFIAARELSRTIGAENSSHYLQIRRASQDLQDKLPSQPPRFYTEQWVSWSDFLGKSYRNKNDEIKERESKNLNFEDAKKLVHSLKLKNVDEYGKSRRNDQKLAKLTPAAPPKHYQNEWKGWSDFLGPTYINLNRSTSKFLSYKKAQLLIRKYPTITNSASFQLVRRSTQELSDSVPSNPSSYYKDEWLGWAVFLGDNYR